MAVEILPETLSPRWSGWPGRFNAALAASVCGVVAWIAAGEALRQLYRVVMTNAVHPVPRGS